MGIHIEVDYEVSDLIVVNALIDVMKNLIGDITRLKNKNKNDLRDFEKENLKDYKKHLKHIKKTLKYFTSPTQYKEIKEKMFATSSEE